MAQLVFLQDNWFVWQYNLTSVVDPEMASTMQDVRLFIEHLSIVDATKCFTVVGRL